MHEAALACKITPGRDVDDHDRWDQESSILMLYSDLCSYLLVPENSSCRDDECGVGADYPVRVTDELPNRRVKEITILFLFNMGREYLFTHTILCR